MAPRYNNNNNNNDHDEDENDTPNTPNTPNSHNSNQNNQNNEEWSEHCLYRRMLRGSQRIQMMKRRYQSSINNENKDKSILEQALETADIESVMQQSGIKVLHINIHNQKKKTFDLRYLSIDETCQHILLMAKPPSQTSKNDSSSSLLSIDVADIDAWHVGTVATGRAELARRLEATRSKGTSEFDQVAMEKLLTIYHNSNQTLDLVVPVSQQLNLIVASLAEIHNTFHRTQPWISKEFSLLRYICGNMVPLQSSMQMTLTEFCQICQRLNIGDKDAAFCFQSKTHLPTIAASECIHMLRSLKPARTQATILWDFLFGGTTTTITHKELHYKFLTQIQSEGHLSLRQAQALLTYIQTIEVAHPQSNNSSNPADDNLVSLQKEQFEEFLFSDLNDAYDPQIQQLDQRLDQPLSEYWINTSYKTYLSNDGSSNTGASVEGYMKALLRGAKCLDLDCWDGPSYGGANGNTYIPMVGPSANAKHHQLLFRHVCDVVEAYLKMHPTSYPIILSMENYCSLPYQEGMATILHEILGHRLVKKENHHNGDQQWSDLPSPEALRGRVILHAKGYPEFVVTNDKKPQRASFLAGLRNRAAEGDVVEITGVLQQMVFLQGDKLEGNVESSNDNKNKILSMAQRELKLGMKEQDHRKHNGSHLTRSHPNNDKHQNNPIHAWSKGCQLVALPLDDSSCSSSSQDVHHAILLNDGLFRQQNGNGYVQKPPFVLGQDPTIPIALFVRVLGGRCLPSSSSGASGAKSSSSPPPQLSVKVTLYDVQSTSNETEQVCHDCHTTCSVLGSGGFAPVWKDRGKKFRVQQPEIAMVLFQVLIGDNIAVASAAIPVACLRKGYRSIQFFDDHNCRTGALRYASLLVHIEY